MTNNNHSHFKWRLEKYVDGILHAPKAILKLYIKTVSLKFTLGAFLPPVPLSPPPSWGLKLKIKILQKKLKISFLWQEYKLLVTKHLSTQAGAVMAMIVWWLDLQLPMQSVPITNDVSLNLDQGEVYNIM